MKLNAPQPPRWANQLLERFCRPDMLEELQGDILELFEKRLQSVGVKKARRLFVIDILKAMRFFTIRKSFDNYSTAMYRNYFIIGLRNISRQKLHSAINIFGLAIGMACFLLILFYVRHELSYDRFHEDYDHIVRVSENQLDRNGARHEYATSFFPLAPVLQSNYPAVDQAVRIFQIENSDAVDALQINASEQSEMYIEEDFVFVDSNFLDVFSFRLLVGDPTSALESPLSVVLTRSTAEKYFGEIESALGRTLEIKDNDSKYIFEVTGVLEDVPQNSHLKFDFLGSLSSYRQIIHYIDNWWHPPLHTYVKLNHNTSAQDFQDQLVDLPGKVFDQDVASTRNFVVTPVSRIHLHSHSEGELEANGHIMYVYLFILIGAFILLIACINFMNLSTSQAARRAREIGIRKTMGARKSQIVQQFLGESFMMACMAFLMAIFLVQLLLPSFGSMVGVPLTADYFTDWRVPLIIIMVLVGVGLLAGTYPSFFMSSIKIVSVLKGLNLKLGSKTLGLRKGLVVTQFVISCALIVATLVIYQQIRYMENKNLGFDKDQVLYVPLRDTENQMNYEPLKEQWKQIPGVISITASSGVPTTEGLYDFIIKPKNASMDSLEIMVLTVDPDFSEVYELELVDGRDFSPEFGSDANQAVVLNESAVNKLGWTDDPVGRELLLDYYFQGYKEKNAKVIGVVGDFNYHSLHKPVIPILMHMIPNSYYHDYLSVKFQPGQITNVLAGMEEVWRSYNPDRPFEYNFLDETFAALYRAESRLHVLQSGSDLYSLFGLVCPLGACV
jgi:putative ABC transport system permease protein